MGHGGYGSEDDEDFEDDYECEIDDEDDDFGHLHPGISFDGERCERVASGAACVLPCLPFDEEELLLPGHARTLHLTETRHLALLDEALLFTNRRFAHVCMKVIYETDDDGDVVVDEDGDPVESGLSFPANLSVLCHIEHVQRVDIGALVRVRGEQPLLLCEFEDTMPYLRAKLKGVEDDAFSEDYDIESLLELEAEVRETFEDAYELATKLSPDDVDGLEETLEWVEALATGVGESPYNPYEGHAHGADDEYSKYDASARYTPRAKKGSLVPPEQAHVRASRLSFAAFAEIPGSTDGEEERLCRVRVRCLETQDVRLRLTEALEYLVESRSSLCAKLAINSIGAGAM